MLKFLRQYNKWILAVFGTLLLIAFLVPTTITEISRRSAALGGTWAHHRGSKVTEEERLKAAGQLEVLFAMARATGTGDIDRIRALTGLDRRPEHWYLLVQEAQEAGLVGGPEEARRWIQEQLAFGTSPVTEAQFVARLAAESRQSPSVVLEAISNMRGVLRLLSVAGAIPVSDARAKIAAAQSQMGAACEVLVLDARAPLPGESVPEPTDAQLREQFERYREVAPGSGENDFGYRIPDRLKLEWIRIPAASVRASLENDPRLGSLELRKAYLRDPGAFMPPTIAGGYPDFESVESTVREKVMQRLALERMREIERFVEDQTAMGLRGLPRRGGYIEFTAEARARQPSFDSIVKAISEQFGIQVPDYTAVGDEWILPQDAGSIPGLGTASTTRFGTQPRRLPELLRSLREFGGSPTIIVQEGVTSPPLHAPSLPDTPADLFFFRVVEAQPSHAPASIDEVLEQVKQDLARLVRFEALVAMRPEIEAMAIESGLQAVGERFGATPAFAPRVSEFAPPIIPGLGNAPEVVKAIIDRAMRLPKTTPVADLPVADKIFTVEAKEKLALVVVRITNIMPLSAEDFETYASMGLLMRMIEGRVPGVRLPEIFGFDALSDRHDFKLARADGSSEE